MESQTGYRRDIDGLRAVAVLGIVAYHAFPALVPGGFVGVDVFFVISGYLITRIIAGERDAGRFAWGRFYWRRARRIVPALVLVLLATAALAALIELPRQLKMTGAAMGVSALFSANLLFAKSPGYFAPALQENPFLHIWSLGVEEQFYILWPFLIWGLSRPALRGVRPWLAAGLLLLSLAAAQFFLMRGEATAAFFGLHTRAWEFLTGGVLALGLVKPPRSAGWAEAGSALGLVFIVLSFGLLNERMPFPGLAALPACLGAALVVWSGEGRSPRAAALLRWAPMVGVGLISYSLYLWHWPLLVFAAELAMGPPAWPWRLALVLLTFGLAWLSWRYVEQPFRRSPAERPWRRLCLALVPLGLAFGVGALFYFGKGLPQRLSPSARAAAAIEVTDVNLLRKTCFEHRGGLAPKGCRFGAAPDAMDYDVLVWGDSHADAVTPGVVAWAASRGWSVREATQGGCPPFTDRRIQAFKPIRRNCRATVDLVMKEVAANRSLKLVVLAARWPLYRDAPPFYDANSPRISAAAGVRALEHDLTPSLSDTVAALHKASPARVLIIGPVPELTFVPPECLARNRQLHRSEAACWSAPAKLPLMRLRPAEAQIAAAVKGDPRAAVVFPSRDLCDEVRCLSAMDGRLIYFDDDHLAASAAKRLVPGWLDAALGPSLGVTPGAARDSIPHASPPSPSAAARGRPAGGGGG